MAEITIEEARDILRTRRQDLEKKRAERKKAEKAEQNAETAYIEAQNQLRELDLKLEDQLKNQLDEES